MDKLSLSLLGPFEALLAKRPLPPFRTSKIQALLIYLAVSASENTAVSHRREAVMELLWSDILRKSAQDNLRQTLYLLRKAIPPQKNANGEQILLILSNRLTVQLNPDYPIDVDITRFSKLVKQAGTGSREETAVFLEEAVTLYRGDFLTDFYLTDSSGFEAWAAAKRAMFRERVFTALDSLSSFFAATEEHEKAAQYARKQLALDDLRETAVRQLMHALVKMGQRSQALAEYEQCQQRLFHELNIEPSQETQSLAKQIQADEVRQTIVTAVQPVPEKLPVQPVPHNLPVQPTPFIGRELELSKLDELVTQSNNRLVTIVGPGGMGKTRLALAWAEQCRDTISGQRQFPDGLFFVNLAPLNLGDSMISTLATALEFPLGGSQDKRPPAQQILDYLEKKQLLLIMDNFEHLIPHPSASLEKMQDHVALVNSILQRATTVTLIITSRERLHLRAEQVYPIQGLLFPDWETPEDALTYTAVQLFLQSAQRNQPNFTLSAEQDLKYLARICRLVEGMPLALELAASWVDALSLADIAAEIRHGFDFLETEMRDMPERHRSMRAVLDGSWKQLGETETRIFEQLSVFRGGFTRAAAQEVADASVRQLARLVQKSLLYVDEENGRYHLHELVRQYGAEKLAVDRERETAVCDQHSQYYCTLLSERESDLKGARQADALNELEIEFNNIRTAWHRAVAHFRIEDVTQAMNALGFFLVQKVSLDDSLTIFQRLWENLDKADTSDLNQVLASVLCWQSSFVFDAKLREKYRNRIQSLLEQPPLNQLDYWPQKPFVLHRLAKLTFLQDQHVTRQRLEESLNYYQVAGDRWGESEILLELGYLALFYNIQDVASFQEKSLQMKRSIGDLKGISQAVYLKAKLLIDQGHLQDSKSLLQEFMEINQKLDSKRGIAGAFYNLGFVDLLEGKFDSALRNFYESLDINRLLGSGEPIALNKSAICWVYCHKGEYKIAKKWGNESLEIAQTHIFPHIIIYAHNFLGMAALGQSTFHLAENHLQNSKTLLDE